jgi:hypothetical protein
MDPYRSLVARHPMVAFLAMLYAITWTVFLPVVSQGGGLLELPIDLSEGLAFNAVLAIASILGIALPSSSQRPRAVGPGCATYWADPSAGASECVGTL